MHVMVWTRCYVQLTFRMTSDLSKQLFTNRQKRISICKDIFKQPLKTFPIRKMASSSASITHQNKLAFEKSPYLLQHASNPVNWYPWGDEALEAAKKENKVIFLSVGYSTCHWCHVMEKESFENPDVAKIMNEHFINIKVDREERPDIDRVYMTFIQSISGHGGWPMSVFLTPDLKPITGGTYFPPDDKYGTPGFKRVLHSVATRWSESQSQILEISSKIIDSLKESLKTKAEGEDQNVPSIDGAKNCVSQLSNRFDKKFGGFSPMPKFPQPSNFNLLFLMYARDPTEEIGKNCLHMCIHTLTKMAYGGIHDHVGKGFSRYSVDDKWHVPHFEKMLYDQGQLLRSYCEAYLATKNPLFADVSNDIVKYVVRDLRHSDGGFYSAEDADSLPTHESSKKSEGAFYVWKYSELEACLDIPVPEKENLSLKNIFYYHFNIKPEGNISSRSDPHGELTNQNVLIIYGSLTETAEHFALPEDLVKSYIKKGLDILFEERNKRPRPHLDDKFITAWNGLMITGLSYAASTFNDTKYVEYAENAAKFIKRYLYDEETKTLLRSCYRGAENQVQQTSVPIKAFQVDYAFLIQGLLDLYEASLNTNWLEFAESLQDIQDQLFWDQENGSYFATRTDDPSIILHFKDDQDTAEPSGNSVACRNLLRLSAYLNRLEMNNKAVKILSTMRDFLEDYPIACPELTCSLINYQDSLLQIYIIGKTDGEGTQKMLQVVREHLIPGKVLFVANENDTENILFRKNVFISKMKALNGKATAYLCRNRVCSLPVTEPTQLAQLLTTKEI